MDPDTAIKVEHLAKQYVLRHRTGHEANGVLDALQDVSFELRKGESAGIIGPNGSGKSTLLKILAGVTKPTSGSVSVRGRIASILDIGAGFHPELSGKENVFLNGQIHGFTKKEIAAKFDEIVQFSGIGEFIHEPVKSYSNGMYLRLAFSIMVHLDFDVYLFDEVFSVGDAAFALKTREKFLQLLQSDKTMLFVSHNLNELLDQDHYILLEKGRLKAKTHEKSLLSGYLEGVLRSEAIEVHTETVTVTDFSKYRVPGEISLLSVRLFQDGNMGTFRTDHAFLLDIEFLKTDERNTMDIVLSITDSRGNIVLSSSPLIEGKYTGIRTEGKYHCTCKIPASFFGNQTYRVSISFFINMKDTFGGSAGNHVESEKEQLTRSIVKYDNFLTFKPELKIHAEGIDLSAINLDGGLLPAFDWNLALTE